MTRHRTSAAVALALLAGLAAALAPAASAQAPLDGDGMWIWQVPLADRGNPDAIAARAAAHGVEVVVIKAAGGTAAWPQFSPALVAALEQRGLRVCGYQYVFGVRPKVEARVAAGIVARGADCLMIDAETEYEGRYAQAQAYIRELRRRIGNDFPVGLTSYPYVHFHPAFPYSVFLGPGGAQFNVPQMYWHSIGTSVDVAYSVTYTYNRLYERPIYPLGQVALGPPAREVRRFRRVAVAYGAAGVSWWSWQHARPAHWTAVGVLVPALVGFPVPVEQPLLARGARGDLVVWAQQHLRSAGSPVPVDGAFGSGTQAAVRSFQAARSLPATGRIDTTTWNALLSFEPAPVTWRATRRGNRAVVARAGARNGPRSAFLPAVRNELGRMESAMP